jgi:hypothetical protein
LVAAGPAGPRLASLSHRGRDLLVRSFDQGGRANRGLTVLLSFWLGALIALGLPEMLRVFHAGLDLEIPLRAASRWAGQEQPYPAWAMEVQFGPDLPYLYPPFLLPILAPIAALPRDAVTAVWLVMCAACAVWTCRRLGLPWPAIPFALAWPPFAEGLITGNVQIWSFAAFVAVFYEAPHGFLRQRDLGRGRDAVNGVLATAVGALKVAQMLPLLYVLRRRWQAALAGVAVLLAIVLVTLPFTGLAVYGDWLAQLRRAADPGWTIGGVALGRQLGIPDLALAGVGVIIALTVRGRDSAAWLGIALLIATPSVHGYTMLFLLPCLVTIRRDVALLLGFLFLGNYHGYAWWIACLFGAYFLVAMRRWPWLRRAEGPDGQAEQETTTAPPRPGEAT